MKYNNIPLIVLTGGPCAGKTTALNCIVDHFTEKGYKVFTLPEVPTMFTAAGMNYLTSNADFFFEGEKSTMEIQIALEDSFMRMAATIHNHPAIVICDRGTMDISAYMSEEQWQTLMGQMNTDSETLRGRYDAVIHLVSAAKGLEHHYTTANNAQRLETADETGLQVARMLDDRVMQAWKGHPRLTVIDNGEDFSLKMSKVVDTICRLIEC